MVAFTPWKGAQMGHDLAIVGDKNSVFQRRRSRLEIVLGELGIWPRMVAACRQVLVS